MFTSCLEKQAALIKKFSPLLSPESKYQLVMEMGRQLAPLDPVFKSDANIVKGCQSIVHLHASLEDGKMFFKASSEALISAGLAALLIAIYDGESPEAVLRCAPTCLDELGIRASLSPGRSNGLSSMHLRMQKEALNFLVISSAKTNAKS